MTVLLKVAKKRRNLMKKLINIMLYIFLIFHLTGCIKVNSGIKTHHVDSQIYQQDDIDLAIETIKKEFKNELNKEIPNYDFKTKYSNIFSSQAIFDIDNFIYLLSLTNFLISFIINSLSKI